MNAYQFCNEYTELVEQLDWIVDPSLHPAIRRLYNASPQDLVEPDSHFVSRTHAIGYILCILLREAEKDGVKTYKPTWEKKAIT